MPKIKGAVFDLDHTLFDRYATLTEVMKEFVVHFDISENYDLEKATQLIIYADKNFNNLGWKTVLSYMAQQGLFNTVPSIEEYSAFVLGEFKKTAVEYPFAKPALTSLKESGYKVALITNGKPEVQNKKIDLLGLRDYFDEIVISGELGIDKPAPEPFIEMAKRLDAEPEELLYIGDNPLNDVEGSRNAGYIPVWVKTTGIWGFDDIEKPEYCVETVTEIPELIEKINNS